MSNAEAFEVPFKMTRRRRRRSPHRPRTNRDQKSKHKTSRSSKSKGLRHSAPASDPPDVHQFTPNPAHVFNGGQPAMTTIPMGSIQSIHADSKQPRYEEALNKLKWVQFSTHHIMNRHNLRVNQLCELDPIYTGVNGCNISRGETIIIRLRNETNSDFRSMEEIIDTMLHELSHNLYPNHDREFYKFWSTLRKEYFELRHSGHRDVHVKPNKIVSLIQSLFRPKILPPKSAFPLETCQVAAPQFQDPPTSMSMYAPNVMPGPMTQLGQPYPSWFNQPFCATPGYASMPPSHGGSNMNISKS